MEINRPVNLYLQALLFPRRVTVHSQQVLPGIRVIYCDAVTFVAKCSCHKICKFDTATAPMHISKHYVSQNQVG